MSTTSGPDYYDVLDVDPTATAEEIRDAWRAAIADLTPTDRRFRLYNQAAEVLLDPDRRAAYDAELAAQMEEEQEQVAEPAPADESPAVPAAAAPPRPAPAAVTTARNAWSARAARRPVSTRLLVGLAVLTLASVALMGWLFTQPSEASVEEAAAEARSAAERAVVPVLSYDHRTLDEDREAAREWMTDDQKEEYDELFELIEENAPRTRTVVDVEVLSSAVVRAGEDRTEVLLFVDRPTTNKANREPVVYKDQVTLTMQRVDGEWLVDGLRTSPVAP